MNSKLKLILAGTLLVVATGCGVFAADNSGKPDSTNAISSGAASTGATIGERKILYYKSSMMPGETNSGPGKDSMGMDMVPVYAGQTTVSNTTSSVPAGKPVGERKIKYYKSTMLPGEISQHPGKDSMGMDMVPVYEEQTPTANPSEIAVDPVTIQDMDIVTTPVITGPLRRTVRTVGYVDYNEPALADVTTKFKGWIEKLYADYTGQLVHKGEPLFAIYSPELYSAQVEYVEVLPAINTVAPSAEDKSLLQSARTKLKFFDISDAQIAELEKTREPRKTLTIDAPMSGFVIEKNIVEGQMVDAGMTLYRLANLDVVWVYAQIYEQDLPYVQLGQEATMTLSYLPGRTFHGRVTYIYPTVDEKTRTAKVRLEFENPDYSLKPGMFANVKLTAEVAPSALLVPDSAVLRSGEKDTVFIALPGGKFDPRTVTLGLAAENDYDQVLSGLQTGEQVVTSGEFMLDSESQLQEAIQKMTEPEQAPTATNEMSGATNSMPGMNMSK